jgi:hypothetical protein
MVDTDCQQNIFDRIIHIVKNPHDQYLTVFQILKNVGTENKDEKIHPVVIHDGRVDPEKRKLRQIGSRRSMQQMIKVYKRVSKSQHATECDNITLNTGYALLCKAIPAKKANSKCYKDIYSSSAASEQLPI